MNSNYFDTKFNTEEEIEEWPEAFAIITAYATSGEKWSDQMNKAADKALKAMLICKSPWTKRITGYSPETGHAEPGWASEITWDQACDLGLEFKQDAIYYVSKNTLSVSYCDERREVIHVGDFINRTSIHSDGKGRKIKTLSLRKCTMCARMLVPKFAFKHEDRWHIHWPKDQPNIVSAETENELVIKLASWLQNFGRVENKGKHIEPDFK